MVVHNEKHRADHEIFLVKTVKDLSQKQWNYEKKIHTQNERIQSLEIELESKDIQLKTLEHKMVELEVLYAKLADDKKRDARQVNVQVVNIEKKNPSNMKSEWEEKTVTKTNNANSKSCTTVKFQNHLDHPRYAEHKMRVEYTEVRCSSWNGAADLLISSLKDKGIKPAQVISIDAHNNGRRYDAIFTAFFDRNTAIYENDCSSIGYKHQNEYYPWERFYTKSQEQAVTVDLNDILGITGSCNANNRSVFYVFHQIPSKALTFSSVFHVEYRAPTWNEAAVGIIGMLGAHRIERGQILSIDAHNNGEGEEAIFSAHWSPSVNSIGAFSSINYKKFSGKYSWDRLYYECSLEANNLRRCDLISITGSINERDSSVMFVFYYT